MYMNDEIYTRDRRIKLLNLNSLYFFGCVEALDSGILISFTTVLLASAFILLLQWSLY